MERWTTVSPANILDLYPINWRPRIPNHNTFDSNCDMLISAIIYKFHLGGDNSGTENYRRFDMEQEG